MKNLLLKPHISRQQKIVKAIFAYHPYLMLFKKAVFVKRIQRINGLRDCFATSLLDNGSKIHFIQQLLRPTHPTISEIYIDISKSSLEYFLVNKTLKIYALYRKYDKGR
jgi:site-specific recombinase XerD